MARWLLLAAPLLAPALGGSAAAARKAVSASRATDTSSKSVVTDDLKLTDSSSMHVKAVEAEAAKAAAEAEKESEARAEAEAKAQALLKAQAKAEAEAKAKADAEAKAKAEAEARTREQAQMSEAYKALRSAAKAGRKDRKAHHSRGHHGKENATVAVAQKPQVAAIATASTVSEKKATQVSVDAETLAASVSSGASQLQQELAEVKQHRVNVKQLQETLAADVALLRESTTLEKLSTSRRNRQVADLQLKKSEQLVKDTSVMLRETRAEALKDAQGVLRQVSQLQQAINVLRAEAEEQVRLFGAAQKGSEAAPAAPAAAAPAARQEPPPVTAKPVAPVAAKPPSPPPAKVEAAPSDSAESEAEEELAANSAAPASPPAPGAAATVVKAAPTKPAVAVATAADAKADDGDDDDLDADNA